MKSYINRHYFIKYKNFIQSRKDHPKNTYTEKHHIIPLSIKRNNKIISLSGREHYIAHKLLTKVFYKNTPYWFSMAKAFNRMFNKSFSTSERYFNSRDYEYRKQLHSDAMKYNNPMHNPEIVKKSRINSIKSWTPERRMRAAELSSKPLVQSAKDKLSKFWKDKKRPRKPGQDDKIIKSTSCGIFITTFGSFDSPGQASRSKLNINNMSRFVINKLCKRSVKGFTFISNGRKENRGHWKK